MHYPYIKTTWVNFDSAVVDIKGHMDLGRDVYIPVNARFSGDWDGYPFGIYKPVRKSSRVSPSADGQSAVLHVMASDRPASILKTMAVGAEDADRIISTFCDLGLHVFSGHSVEMDGVGTTVEPYSISHLISGVVQDAKGVHIAFAGERKPLVLRRPEHSAAIHTAIWAREDQLGD